MRGCQVNFYLGPSDQEPFEGALRKAGEIVVLKYLSSSAAPECQRGTVISRMGEEPLRVLLARPEDVDAIRFEPVRGRQEYSCSSSAAPIIEFDRCFVSGDFIRRGRLYYLPRHYDAAAKPLVKPAAFLSWARRLLKRARASLQMIEHNDYAGPDALRLREAGVPFEAF